MISTVSDAQLWGICAIGGVALVASVYVRGVQDGTKRAEAAFQASTALQWQAHAKTLQDQHREMAALDAKTLTLSTQYAQDLAAVVAQSQRVLDGVRQRTPRPDAPSVPRTYPHPGPDTARLGATGAELYREDSRFLVGEAARADEIRLALMTCHAQYNAVRAARGGPP